jgi:predicted O-methyltransferase YrrM
LIKAALIVPFNKLYSYPQSSTGVFDFLGQLIPGLPEVPPELLSTTLPDEADSRVIQSSEPEVARTLYVLSRLLKAHRIVEVGVYRGATSRLLARALADNGGGILHLVDLSPEALVSAQAASQPHPSVSILGHCGLSTATQMLGEVPAECDLIYLDADHSESGVHAELTSWLPKLRAGGIVGVHDSINVPGVCRAVHRFSAGRSRLLTVATGRGSGLSLIQTCSDVAVKERCFHDSNT